MPRHSREKSGTGIYHVMLRGINRQDIFEDDDDYRKMILCLRGLVERTDRHIVWCNTKIMKNENDQRNRPLDHAFGAIDSLTITYDGNRLLKVTDDAETLNYNGALDFDDGDDSTCEYHYDGNGALTYDSNRGISKITYDYSHYPSLIAKATIKKRVDNDYTPDGRKLYSLHVSYIPIGYGTYSRISIKDLYVDGLILRSDTALLWKFSGGYVELNANGTPTSWNYYITDHLGSTRMVVDSNNNIKETINYYPFGSEMKMEDPALLTGGTSHPYRFTGKELEKVNSLNMYDFGARWYDVAGVPMWTSMDPLAEKYYNISPYAYCAGNPVNAIDKGGKDITFLIASKGAGGYGHMGAIIGNNSTFYYITAGATNTNKGLFSNSNQEGGISIVKIEESSMSDAITFVRNNDKYNSYYNDYITFSTSKKMDDAMIKEATNKQENFKNGEEHYRLFTNNCADIVKDIFEKGTDSDLHMGISPSPNDNFANIKDKQNDIQNELNEKIHDEKRK